MRKVVVLILVVFLLNSVIAQDSDGDGFLDIDDGCPTRGVSGEVSGVGCPAFCGDGHVTYRGGAGMEFTFNPDGSASIALINLGFTAVVAEPVLTIDSDPGSMAPPFYVTDNLDGTWYIGLPEGASYDFSTNLLTFSSTLLSDLGIENPADRYTEECDLGGVCELNGAVSCERDTDCQEGICIARDTPWCDTSCMVKDGGVCIPANPALEYGVSLCFDINDVIDGDGVDVAVDNCPTISNADQFDSDGDGVGDVCDNCLNVANGYPARWVDCDVVNNDADPSNDCPPENLADYLQIYPMDPYTCLFNPNRHQLANYCNQVDFDGDNLGNACDPDVDGDGISDVGNFGNGDNCIFVSNSDQLNSDSDHAGDACDNCPTVNNGYQRDLDSDGIGDECEIVGDVGSPYPSVSKVVGHILGISSLSSEHSSLFDCDGAVDVLDLVKLVKKSNDLSFVFSCS